MTTDIQRTGRATKEAPIVPRDLRSPRRGTCLGDGGAARRRPGASPSAEDTCRLVPERFLAVIDNTIVNVAVPTDLGNEHATVPQPEKSPHVPKP